MASVGFNFGKWGAHFRCNSIEAKKAAVPCLFIGSTIGFVGLSSFLIYSKYKTASECMLKTHQYDHELEVIKVQGETDKDVYTSKRLNDVFAAVALSGLRKEQNKIDEEGKEEDTELTIRQAHEIPVVDGHYDDHQLIGSLLYREDICLCYGEEHVGKTSIILNWIIDIVSGRKSRIMPDDKGIHPHCQCLWYNGEMNEPDFQNFFGDYDRTRLKDKIYFIENFSDLNFRQWLEKVREQLDRCHTDTIVVLDNMSCICNSSDVELRRMRSIIESIQKEMNNNRGIHVTFLVIDHINKKGDVAGTYKLKALFSTRIRFSSYGEGHTKISVEKNRKYHYMINKSFDLLWTTSPEGYKSFENMGEIVDKNNSSADSPPGHNYADVDDVDDGKKYPDDQILEFHRIFLETENQSEAQRQSGVPRQVYQKRIGKILENGAES